MKGYNIVGVYRVILLNEQSWLTTAKLADLGVGVPVHIQISSTVTV
jgi:hypothetical protein